MTNSCTRQARGGTLADVLLDTHALVWWLGERGKLSQSAMEAIKGAQAVRISAISFWEVGMLVAKGRISLDRPMLPSPLLSWRTYMAIPQIGSLLLRPSPAQLR